VDQLLVAEWINNWWPGTLEVIEDRNGLKATIVTSQVPVANWHDTIGDPTIADAILDRLVNRAHRIELKGPSLRKKRGNDDE